MPNITISLDEDLLKAARRYVKKHHISLKALIRKALKQTIQPESMDWLDKCFGLMDKANGNSKGSKWKRGDLYSA
jgi:hypothetical protein